MKTKLVLISVAFILLNSSVVLASKAAPVVDLNISKKKTEKVERVEKKDKIEKQDKVEKNDTVKTTVVATPTPEPKKTTVKPPAKQVAKAVPAKQPQAKKEAVISSHVKNAPAYENPDAKLGAARLTPTVYFVPTYDLDNDPEAQCSSSSKVLIHGLKENQNIEVCKDIYNSCLLQGTCHLVRGDKKISLGYSTQKEGIHYFEMEEGESRCPYGVGVRNICMDPYFTVAADLKYHKVGSVIYVPAIVGTVLPGGYKHNGFFIVRDRGGAIKGAHRFDFFIGESKPGKESNPFHEINLQSKKHKKYYYLISGETADKFREARNFKYPRPKKTKSK